ncbi:MAG: 2-C-methyl-D-erythritol 4-phosphate cytidylyltransferase [Flavobacteriales bacterium CG18_big_fil_WC_8_21_14_2_50_32_9]|nr:MAG: 2-C-methyl-D-erythritol 4-phosphate cytidylyltransferase [Flavobacteriales bacterium CG18_big_fil_WC_8_21_14_2_50_32_9]PJC62074.1 MAG: 2-C-methyl-D-erythritol 4-phosphate cytidylyltransferase [Flavobacteriales bacterium CG_4_9_14_0_2_um_filter_32_27]
MRKYAIIVAGGKGERMGENIPKQFLELNGKPILMHTIEKFHSTFSDLKIILALPENQFDFWKELCYKYGFTNIPHEIVAGGTTRFHSVQNALALVDEDGIVAVHDGVRPLVSQDIIINCFKTAQQYGNAIPVVDVVDSLRHVTKTENKAVKRSCYKIVQTPQCFQTSLIKKAYQQEFVDAFTDDASVVEATGGKIHLVAGNKENIKITSPEDLVVAEALNKQFL